MSFFSVIKEGKARYEKSVEKKRKLEKEKEERERQRRETEKRLVQEKEAALMERLESGNLIQGICEVLNESPRFAKFLRGCCERREIIVTPVAVYYNNYDKDTFFQYLQSVETNGKDGVFYTIYRQEYVSIKHYGNSCITEKYPTPETRATDETLEMYAKSNSYFREVLPFQLWEAESIDDVELFNKFAIALKRALQKNFPHLVFSDIQKSKFGFLMFETEVKKENIFPEIREEANQLDLRVRLKELDMLLVTEEIKFCTEESIGVIKKDTLNKLESLYQEIIEINRYLECQSCEDKQKLEGVYLNLGETLYTGYGNDIHTEEAYQKIVYAQELFAKVLPFQKEKYNLDEVRSTIKYLATLEAMFFWKHNDIDIKYLEVWHDVACVTFERSRELFTGEMEHNINNLNLISSILKIKILLNDFDGAEQFLEKYISSGADEEEIKVTKRLIEERKKTMQS